MSRKERITSDMDDVVGLARESERKLTRKPIEYRHGNDGLNDVMSFRTQTIIHPDTDRAQQAHKDDSDINTIVRRFGITGQLPPARLPGQYGDFTGVMDYQSALNAMMHAQEVFDSLPATVRERFGNDPGKLIDFVNRDDDESVLEARKLGLVPEPEAPVPPQRVEVVNPTPPAAAGGDPPSGGK